MLVLDQVGLTEAQELSVLEFCCEISSMPYNRRTSKSLSDIIKFIAKIKQDEKKDDFQISMRQGFRWWWAFTKKHNIISLYYQGQEQKQSTHKAERKDSLDSLLSAVDRPETISFDLYDSK